MNRFDFSFLSPSFFIGWLAVLLLCASSARAVTFIDIWEYRVVGNTILPDDIIQRNLDDYLGSARTIDDVEAAAKTLQNLYKTQGYPAVFVEIPPQTVIKGVFTLKVTETKLRRLKVSGASYFLPSLIKSGMPSLETGRPLSLPELQQDIRYINAINQDLKVVPLLNQGPTPETIDVELDIDDRLPIRGSVELNNYSSQDTTDTRLSMELGYGNLWQKHHDFSLQTQVSPEDTDEVNVVAAKYLAPVGLKGEKLAFFGLRSDSDIITLGDVRVVGDGFVLGGRYIKPIKQIDRQFNTIILGADYKDFDENIDPDNPSPNSQTPIEYVSFTAQFSQVDGGDSWSQSMSVALSFGVRGFFNSNEEFDDKRSRAEPNFNSIKFSFDHLYRLSSKWAWSQKLNGQISDGPVVSNEQFSAGGVRSVRGYFESQISADAGISASSQLETPSLFGKKGSWLRSVNLYGFVEGAYLANNDSGLDEEDELGLAAIGFGGTSVLKDGFSFKFDVGYPLVSEGEVDQGDVKITGSVKYEF